MLLHELSTEDSNIVTCYLQKIAILVHVLSTEDSDVVTCAGYRR